MCGTARVRGRPPAGHKTEKSSSWLGGGKAATKLHLERSEGLCWPKRTEHLLATHRHAGQVCPPPDTHLDKGTQDKEDEVQDGQSRDDVVVQEHRLVGLVAGYQHIDH